MGIFGLVFEMQSQTKEDLWYTLSMRSEQCDVPILNQGANTDQGANTLKKIIDKNYLNVRDIIEEDAFDIHNAIYEELPFNEEEIGIAKTLKTVNDDVKFYKEVEDLQKTLQNFNIGALSIDQRNFFCEQSLKLRKWMVAVEKMIARSPTNSMPCARISIEGRQMNLTWTRLGFNVSKTTHMHDIGESSTTMALPAEVQFPRPDANFESRTRQYVANKHSQPRLPKLKKQIYTACGTHNVMLI